MLKKKPKNKNAKKIESRLSDSPCHQGAST